MAKNISAQVSLYPLRTEHLGPPIEAFAEELRGAGLQVEPGPMSTLVVGGAEVLFPALQRAFEAASAEHQVVMEVAVSNACPEVLR
ncbi:MAG: YkoF family thiamine/hydroxymethylpyrimidine-binding protein [Armatimonadota bacterium]|nr:YkoF family thiamine/hydroxymethylpyrimidine-binding protein [Armatimonadota bacterium]